MTIRVLSPSLPKRPGRRVAPPPQVLDKVAAYSAAEARRLLAGQIVQIERHAAEMAAARKTIASMRRKLRRALRLQQMTGPQRLRLELDVAHEQVRYLSEQLREALRWRR